MLKGNLVFAQKHMAHPPGHSSENFWSKRARAILELGLAYLPDAS